MRAARQISREAAINAPRIPDKCRNIVLKQKHCGLVTARAAKFKVYYLDDQPAEDNNVTE